ncbi:MAG: hypothetical protein U9R74_06515 [Pseudomonadota bacterium]|nr:hypothetical protein [Pseudomonadota bacterium]
MLRKGWYFPVSMASLVGFLLPACGQEIAVDQKAFVTGRSQALRAEPDPCSVIVTKDGSVREPGKTIDSLKDRLQSGIDPVPLLERIGWFYVDQARTRNDPGLYSLANAAAGCIKEQQPDSAEAMLLEGHVLHSRHRFHDAEQLARRLAAERGLWFDYALLGDALFDLGRIDDATDAYQKMMDLRPGPQAYLRAAQLRWITGDPQGAIEMMQRAIRAGDAGHPESKAWAYARLATFELHARRTTDSARHIQAALQLKPGYPPALLTRARLALSRDDPAAALADLLRAREQSALPEVRWLLADVQSKLGNEAAADAIVARLTDPANREDPRTVSLFLATGPGDPDRALEIARAELTVRQDVFTLDAMAWASLASGDTAAARHYALQAVAEGTQDARLFLHAGIIAARAGVPAEADDWLERSMALSHMLFPSERDLLINDFAAVRSQSGPGGAKNSASREIQAPSGEQHEES